jgi:hypothetical protein
MTKQRKARANTSDNAIPPVAQETALRLEAITDRAAFQSLCDAVLSSHFGYRMHSRGISPRGTVVGRPDSWGHDTAGNLCAFEYGTDRNWRAKLEEDLKSVPSLAGEDFAPTVFVFCTNRHVDATVERSLRAEVQRAYGWELRLYSGIDLANVLDTDLQDVRHRYLGMRISRHTWPSLGVRCW